MRTPTIIESPYAGLVPLNRAYLQACIRDSLSRGETPYASHQMLTDALDDGDPEQRELGIKAGLDMRKHLIEGCRAIVVFYTDLGWSPGMLRARFNGYYERQLSDEQLEDMIRRGTGMRSFDNYLRESTVPPRYRLKMAPFFGEHFA